jgi:excisionase family DNA binding protein
MSSFAQRYAPEFRTIAQAAAEFGVHPDTLRRCIREGTLPAYRLRQRGPWRLHVDDLRDLLTRDVEKVA